MESIFDTATYSSLTSQIVCDVFDTMLQYELVESTDDYAARSNTVTAAIFFAGQWKGAVIIECSEQQCCFLAERMTGIPRPEHMDDDVRDAMGELVNMVGGNLKSVLPKGGSLSMPSVLEGMAYAYKICGTNKNVRFAFQGEAGPLWITLVQVAE